MTPSRHDWVRVVRSSHERLAALTIGLDEAAINGPAYPTEWSIGDTLSHVGSQGEVFALILDAGLAGAPTPGGEQFTPIWDSWNARSALPWRDDSIASNAMFVARVEVVDDAAAEAFNLDFFGHQLDFSSLLEMRLAEHAVHSWDVAVMLDPQATVAPDAVDVLASGLEHALASGRRGDDDPYRVRIITSDPGMSFVLAVDDAVTKGADSDSADVDGTVTLPAEAYLRLLYGRLDPDHTPDVVESGARGLADLRRTFPGF